MGTGVGQFLTRFELELLPISNYLKEKSMSSEQFQQEYKFNTKNVLITTNDVEKIINSVLIGQNQTPIKIRNIEHYRCAFSHSSFSGEQRHLLANDPEFKEAYEKNEKVDESQKELFGYIPTIDNEVYEFGGDAIIDSIVATYLKRRFGKKTHEDSNEKEGFLTKIKIRLVKTARLAEWASLLGFEKWLLLSDYLDHLGDKQQGRNNPKILENAFEAFIGAIIEDLSNDEDPFGYGNKICYHFIVGIIEKYVDFSMLIRYNDNYKDSLLRFFQSQKWTRPEITEIFKVGPPNNRVFKIIITSVKTNAENEEFVPDNNTSPSIIARNKDKTYQTLIKYSETKGRYQLLMKYQSATRIHLCNLKEEVKDQDSEIKDHIFYAVDKFDTESTTKYIIGVGEGRSKKLAEQAASQAAMINIGIPNSF